MKIDFLRHGETLAGTGFNGITDVDLTDKGWQQMQRAVEAGSHDLVITSPLQRCRRFAEDYARRQQLECISDTKLMEMDFGEWEARTPQQLLEEQPQQLKNFWRNPERHGAPGGEPLGVMAQRVQQAVQEIAQGNTRHCLVVSHQGVIALALLQVLGAASASLRQLRIDHGSLSRIEIYAEPESKPSVVFVNHV